MAQTDRVADLLPEFDKINASLKGLASKGELSCELAGLTAKVDALEVMLRALRWVVLALGFVILLLTGVMFGMSLWAAELSKETHTDNSGVMTSTSGKPVVVGQAQTQFALLDFPKASEEVLLAL